MHVARTYRLQTDFITKCYLGFERDNCKQIEPQNNYSRGQSRNTMLFLTVSFPTLVIITESLKLA